MTLIDASTEWLHICLLNNKIIIHNKTTYTNKNKIALYLTHVCICEIVNCLLKPKQCMYTIYIQESINYITWSIIVVCFKFHFQNKIMNKIPLNKLLYRW